MLLECEYFAEYGYLFPLTGRKNYIYEMQDCVQCPKQSKYGHETLKM